MAATYLALVNKVGVRLGWDAISQTAFNSPESPHDAIKDFINEAKDEILDELKVDFHEQEFALQLSAPNSTGTVTSTGANLVLTTTGTTLTESVHGTNQFWKIAPDEQDGWFRITAIGGGSLGIDTIPTAAFTNSAFTAFKDEYNLNNTVRQVKSAWVNDGPIDLDFVSDPFDHDRTYAGQTNMGIPTEMAVYRSPLTAGTNIWQARFRPIPDNNYTVRYKASTRPADLSSYNDFWELPPEIENLIVDRAVFKSLISIQNDPELAQLTLADLKSRVNDYRMRHANQMPYRRLRRRGPDEVPGREVPRLDPTRFH